MLRIASAIGALAVALPLLGVISSTPAGADGYYRGRPAATTGYYSRRSFSGSAIYPRHVPGRGYTMGFRSGPHGGSGYRIVNPASYRVGRMDFRHGYSGVRYHVERRSAYYGDRLYGVRYQSAIDAPDDEVDDRPLYDVGADYDRPDYWGGGDVGYGVSSYSGAGYYQGVGYYPAYVNCGCNSGWSMFR